MYLNYTKDVLLVNGEVEEAQCVLSMLDSHLYLLSFNSYEKVPYKDIKERLKKLDEPLKLYFN